MSLINDALRRATQKRPTPNDLPTMEPIQKPNAQAGGPGMTVILICFVVAGGVCLGAWSYWNKKYKIPALERKKAAAAAAANTNGTARAAGTNVAGTMASKTNNNPIARAANTLNKVQTLNKEGEKTADAMQTKTAPPQPTVTASPTPAPATTIGAAKTQGASAPLKLQAIFYRTKDSTAMINGKTVRAGDDLNGLKIIEIKRNVVVVQDAAGVHELTIK